MRGGREQGGSESARGKQGRGREETSVVSLGLLLIELGGGGCSEGVQACSSGSNAQSEPFLAKQLKSCLFVRDVGENESGERGKREAWRPGNRQRDSPSTMILARYL